MENQIISRWGKRLIWRIVGESVQTLGKQKQKLIYSSIKLKYLLQPKELEAISRYLEVIPFSLREFREQLWDIPESRESF